MSFYGKTFKKISAPNAAEAFEKLGFVEEIYGLLRVIDSLWTFDKNEDGTIRFLSVYNRGFILNNKWFPNKESSFVTGTGAIISFYFNIEENLMIFRLISPSGRILNADAYFNNGDLKMELYEPGVDILTVMHYEVV